jgi:hypothetical protein
MEDQELHSLAQSCRPLYNTAAVFRLAVQVLVVATSVMVVGFIMLLQNPALGSPAWLPLLAGCWAAAFVVTMVLQAALPLPDIQRWVWQLAVRRCLSVLMSSNGVM